VESRGSRFEALWALAVTASASLMSPQDSTHPGVVGWERALPADAAGVFAQLSVPWWIAGGWAIDLFLGRQTRPHGDLDVGVLRRNVGELLHACPGWEVFEARDGSLTRLRSAAPRSNVSSLWCRESEKTFWKFEIMLDESEGDLWVYRRDRAIRRNLLSLILRDSWGIPYLAPEVQLLYKAKHARSQDQLDFAAVVPMLSDAAKDWLREALKQTLPGHSWIRAM
jgi:hypothetical protein